MKKHSGSATWRFDDQFASAKHQTVESVDRFVGHGLVETLDDHETLALVHDLGESQLFLGEQILERFLAAAVRQIADVHHVYHHGHRFGRLEPVLVHYSCRCRPDRSDWQEKIETSIAIVTIIVINVSGKRIKQNKTIESFIRITKLNLWT